MEQKTIDNVVKDLAEVGGRMVFKHSPYRHCISRMAGPHHFQDKHLRLYEIKDVIYYESYDKKVQLSYEN